MRMCARGRNRQKTFFRHNLNARQPEARRKGGDTQPAYESRGKARNCIKRPRSMLRGKFQCVKEGGGLSQSVVFSKEEG